MLSSKPSIPRSFTSLPLDIQTGRFLYQCMITRRPLQVTGSLPLFTGLQKTKLPLYLPELVSRQIIFFWGFSFFGVSFSPVAPLTTHTHTHTHTHTSAVFPSGSTTFYGNYFLFSNIRIHYFISVFFFSSSLWHFISSATLSCVYVFCVLYRHNEHIKLNTLKGTIFCFFVTGGEENLTLTISMINMQYYVPGKLLLHYNYKKKKKFTQMILL